MAKLLCQLSSNWQLELDDFLDLLDIDLDTESNDKRLKIFFEPNEKNPLESEINVFFLIEAGEYMMDVLRLMNSDHGDLKKIASIPSQHGLHTPCLLFKYKNNLIAFLNTDSYCSAEIADILQPYGDCAKDVVVLQIKQKLDYKGSLPKSAKEFDANFIRGINSRINYIEELLPPNVISGTSADIASRRSHNEKSIATYVVFTHTFSEIEMFSLLTDIGIDCLKKPQINLDKITYI